MVSKLIQRCVQCWRPVEEQCMAKLPKERIEESVPFTNCGMDCRIDYFSLKEVGNSIRGTAIALPFENAVKFQKFDSIWI